jgi:hypothetical protein
VPTATLTPMTAAIVEHTLGFGLGVTQGKTRADCRDPNTMRRRRQSAAQGLMVSVGRRF